MALDATAAVASLPPAVVLDELQSLGTPLHTFGNGLVMANVEAPASPIDHSAPFWDSAVHVAVDASRVRDRCLESGRSDIDSFLNDPVLAQALALAIRARRRRVDLPTKLLTHLATNTVNSSNVPDYLPPLLRLVAIAVTPGPAAHGQGRIGLLDLGRAALRSPWISRELARFIGPENHDLESQLGTRLVLASLRPIVSPQRPQKVLPMTVTFVSKWLTTVAPRGATSRSPTGIDVDEQFIARVREIVAAAAREKTSRRTDIRPHIEALLAAGPGGPRFPNPYEDDVILRRFGLAPVGPSDQ